MKAEYVATCEVEKEAVWLWKFLVRLWVILFVVSSLVLFYGNSGAVA